MKKDTKAIKIIKKDGTKEDYNVEKVVIAVKKSANRALITFTDEDIGSICSFVDSRVFSIGKSKIHISEMHNIVESALDMVNPIVAKSYQGLQELQAGLCSYAGRGLPKEPGDYVHRRQGKLQFRLGSGFNQAFSYFQPA